MRPRVVHAQLPAEGGSAASPARPAGDCGPHGADARADAFAAVRPAGLPGAPAGGRAGDAVREIPIVEDTTRRITKDTMPGLRKVLRTGISLPMRASRSGSRRLVLPLRASARRQCLLLCTGGGGKCGEVWMPPRESVMYRDIDSGPSPGHRDRLLLDGPVLLLLLRQGEGAA